MSNTKLPAQVVAAYCGAWEQSYFSENSFEEVVRRDEDLVHIEAGLRAAILADRERQAGEAVASVYTMEALVPGGESKHHVSLHKPLPSGTKLYTLATLPAPQAQAEPLSVGFSPMHLAPIDGTAVLLHLPTTGDGFAIGQWHGNSIDLEGFWGDDEGSRYVHEPAGWMGLHVLKKIAAAPSPDGKAEQAEAPKPPPGSWAELQMHIVESRATKPTAITTGDMEALVKRLRDAPNWLKETYGSWKDCVSKYDRAPFEVADLIEAIATQPTASPEQAEAPSVELDFYDEIECDLPYLFGRASLEGHEAGQRLACQVRTKMQAARAALASKPPAGEQKRCEYCDDTGDVHSTDGEWRGRCTCPAAGRRHQ